MKYNKPYHLTEIMLNDFYLGRLSDLQFAEVFEHLSRCKECSDLADKVGGLIRDHSG